MGRTVQAQHLVSARQYASQALADACDRQRASIRRRTGEDGTRSRGRQTHLVVVRRAALRRVPVGDVVVVPRVVGVVDRAWRSSAHGSAVQAEPAALCTDVGASAQPEKEVWTERGSRACGRAPMTGAARPARAAATKVPTTTSRSMAFGSGRVLGLCVCPPSHRRSLELRPSRPVSRERRLLRGCL